MNNREIKFRAWHDGKMLSMDTGYGYPLFVEADGITAWSCWDDAILMQYTSMKDVNGVEIYEGDIVEAEGMLPSAVIFYESAFRTEPAAEPLSYDAERYGGFTVIGNIYEHGHLLEK